MTTPTTETTDVTVTGNDGALAIYDGGVFRDATMDELECYEFANLLHDYRKACEAEAFAVFPSTRQRTEKARRAIESDLQRRFIARTRPEPSDVR